MRRWIIRAALAGALATGGLLGFSPDSEAKVCAQVDLYKNGGQTRVGPCIPLMDQWVSPCLDLWATDNGTGAGVHICHPRP